MGKIVLIVGIFAGIAALAHHYKWLPDWNDRSSSGSSYSSFGSSRSGDIRVDTPHGKRYAGVPYFGETTINGKRYTTITTYHSRK